MTLGEREGGTARLEEAVATYREALKEDTRERVPLQWAMDTGNQGVALMLLAERSGDAKLAKLGVQQIEAAFTISGDGGDAPSAAFFESQLPKARALAEKLAKHLGPTSKARAKPSPHPEEARRAVSKGGAPREPGPSFETAF